MNEYLTAICRLCLESGEPETRQDFFDPDKDLVTIVEELTGLEILQESNYPSNVCCTCLAHIETLSNFKRTCLESEKSLREGLLIFEIQIVDDKVKGGNQIDNAVATPGVKEKAAEKSLKDAIYSKHKPSRKKHKGRTTIEKQHDKAAATPNLLVHKNTAAELNSESYEAENPDEESNAKPKTPRKKYSTPCHICGKLYARQEMKYHLNMHSGARPFICLIKDCAKAFTSPTNLASHHKMCHTDQYRFACDVCGRSFKVKTTFDIHRSYHFEPELPCNVCGKLLRHPRAIKRHMMSHTGERPFPCNKCSKSFQTKYTLRIHQRVHTREKPFTCAICGRSFSYRCVLRTHMTSAHPDEAES